MRIKEALQHRCKFFIGISIRAELILTKKEKEKQLLQTLRQLLNDQVSFICTPLGGANEFDITASIRNHETTYSMKQLFARIFFCSRKTWETEATHFLAVSYTHLTLPTIYSV